MTGPQLPTAAWRYDAFLSYSHHDRLLAQGLQRTLERIARPFGRRQALRVFRDDTDLTASPDLWGGVVQAMDQARYFVLVMSPFSAKSVWVNRELEHWLQTRGPGSVLLVLGQGAVRWHPAHLAFVPEWSDAAPPVLTQPGVLPREPAYLDVSHNGPWDSRSPAFRAQVTGLAAAIHQVSRRDLENEDVKESKRRSRVRSAVTVSMAVLTAISMILAIQLGVSERGARDSEQAANDARAISEARRLAGAAESVRGGNNALAIGLAREAVAATSVPRPEALQALANAKAAFAEEPLQRVRAPIQAHKGWISGVAVGTDLDLFVTGGWDDGAVRLWSRAAHGQVGSDLQEPSDVPIKSVAMSDERIAAGRGATILLWNAGSRERLPAIPIAGVSAASLTFAPGGRLLAWAENGRVVIRDLETQTTSRTIPLSDDTVEDIAFSRDGKTLAIGTKGGVVAVYQASSGKRVFSATIKDETAVAVAFRPDGENILAVGATDRMIHLYDMKGRETGTLSGHNDSVFGVAFTGDSYLVSGSADGTVGLWDVDLEEAVGQPRAQGGIITGISFDVDGHWLVSSDRDGAIVMWDYRAVPWQVPKVATLDVASSGDVVTGGGDQASVWRAGKRLRTIDVGTKVYRARFLPGGRQLVTAGLGQALEIWQTDSGERVGTLPAGKGQSTTNDLAVSPDGRWLASASDEKTISVWDVATRQLRYAESDDDPLHAVALSKELLAYGGRSDTVVVRDIEDHHVVWQKARSDWVMDIAFNPEGNQLLVGWADGTVSLFDAATGDELRTFRGLRDRAFEVAFSPDGELIAAAARYDGIRVWNAKDGAVLARLLQAPPDPGPFRVSLPEVRTVRFSPDGRGLVAGDAHDLRTWTDLLDASVGCETATRYVARAQMEPYLAADATTVCDYSP